MKGTRREFLQWSSLTGAALILGVSSDGRLVAVEPPAAPFEPNQWLRIDTSGGMAEPLTACVLRGPGSAPEFVFSNG